MNYSTMSFAEFKNFCAAVTSLEPNAKFSVDKEANSLTWTTGTQPSDSAITTEIARLDALYTSQAYARARKVKYDVLNQDEMRYDDVKNSTTTWVDAIDTIKAAHPKPQEYQMSTIKSSAENLTLNADGSGNDVLIQSNGSTKVTVDGATGNVGIGTTPESGQGSNSQGLYVGTHASLISSGAYESVNLSENAYLATAASDAWKYRDTSHAARHEMKAGVHTLKVAASGSADAAITWNTGFEVLNDGKARAKNGLLFGTDTAAANAIDDYEEGNWTPSWTMDSGSVTLTNTTKATYTKIGRTVTVNMYIKVASISSPSGACYVNGLPFVVTDSRQAAAATWASNMTSGSNGSVQARTLGTETRFRVQKFLNGSDSPFANTIAANTELILSMTYNAA